MEKKIRHLALKRRSASTLAAYIPGRCPGQLLKPGSPCRPVLSATLASGMLFTGRYLSELEPVLYRTSSSSTEGHTSALEILQLLSAQSVFLRGVFALRPAFSILWAWRFLDTFGAGEKGGGRLNCCHYFHHVQVH